MEETRLITFTSNKRAFAVPLGKVREVIDMGEVEPLPDTIPPLEGLVIYRTNRVLPVFSMSQLLGSREKGVGEFLLVIGAGDELYGVRVMKIGGILSHPADEQMISDENNSDFPEGVEIARFLDKDEEIIILNLDRLFSKLTLRSSTGPANGEKCTGASPGGRK